MPVLLECGQLIWWYDTLFAARIFTNTYPKLRPWHVLRIIIASFGPLTNSPKDVGIRLRVWWAGNNKYFEGTIVSFRYSEITAQLCSRDHHTIHAIHTVRYDDGDLRDYDLSMKIYEIIVDQNDKKTYSYSLQKHLEIVSSTPTYLAMDPKKKGLSKMGGNRSNREDLVEKGAFAVSWALLSLYQIYLHHLLYIKWENNHDLSTPLHFAEEECVTKVHEKKKEHMDDGFCQNIDEEPTSKILQASVAKRSDDPRLQSDIIDDYMELTLSMASKGARKFLRTSWKDALLPESQQDITLQKYSRNKASSAKVLNATDIQIVNRIRKNRDDEIQNSSRFMDMNENDKCNKVESGTNPEEDHDTIVDSNFQRPPKNRIYTLESYNNPTSRADQSYGSIPIHLSHSENKMKRKNKKSREAAGDLATTFDYRVPSATDTGNERRRQGAECTDEPFFGFGSGYRAAWGQPKVHSEDAFTGVMLQNAWVHVQNYAGGPMTLAARHMCKNIRMSLQSLRNILEHDLEMVHHQNDEQEKIILRFDGYRICSCCLRLGKFKALVGVCRQWIRDHRRLLQRRERGAKRIYHRHSRSISRSYHTEGFEGCTEKKNGLYWSYSWSTSCERYCAIGLTPVLVCEYLRLSVVNLLSTHVDSRWRVLDLTSKMRWRKYMRFLRQACIRLSDIFKLMLALDSAFNRWHRSGMFKCERSWRRRSLSFSNSCRDLSKYLKQSCYRLLAGVIIDSVLFVNEHAVVIDDGMNHRQYSSVFRTDAILAACIVRALGPTRASGLLSTIVPKFVNNVDELVTSVPFFFSILTCLQNIRYFRRMVAWKRIFVDIRLKQYQSNCSKNAPKQIYGWGVPVKLFLQCDICGLPLADSTSKTRPGVRHITCVVGSCGHRFHTDCGVSCGFSLRAKKERQCPLCEIDSSQDTWEL